jgi:hypothetical protein
MSAWIVNTTHLDLLISAGLTLPRHAPLRWAINPKTPPYRYQELLPSTADEVGFTLLVENVASVFHRYPNEPRYKLPNPADRDDEGLLTYRYREIPGVIDPVTVLRSIACYEYQSCEHAGWATSQAHAFCSALREACVTALPGYDSQPWGFDDRDYFLKHPSRS